MRRASDRMYRADPQAAALTTVPTEELVGSPFWLHVVIRIYHGDGLSPPVTFIASAITAGGAHSILVERKERAEKPGGHSSPIANLLVRLHAGPACGTREFLIMTYFLLDRSSESRAWLEPAIDLA
jgi:hypothetical protein